MTRVAQVNERTHTLRQAAMEVEADDTLLMEIDKWRKRLLRRATLADAEETEPVVGGKIVMDGYGTQRSKALATVVRLTRTQVILRFGEHSTEYRYNLKYGREAGKDMGYTGWEIPRTTLEKLRALAPHAGPKVPEAKPYTVADANREWAGYTEENAKREERDFLPQVTHPQVLT